MSIKYRGEIDGLRAIAVLLVIFNHLGVSYLSGGFIGVDIFFVISGFLITSNIRQAIEDNSFSFGSFYKKRIIRLAPAYFLVLFVTTLLMFAILTPYELISYIKSVLYSSGFAANFYMWKSLGGYFSSNAEMTPLLHLWSLGIEEQFYIFWPIALIFLTWLMPKLRLTIIILAILAGLFVSQKIALLSPPAAYFLLPFRAFELLIGAALAFVSSKNLGVFKGNVVSLAGLALIFIPAFSFSKETTFPGYAAFLPCIGTALVIYFCREGFLQNVLSSKPMEFFGKISYPAYLWHWPLIVCLNIFYVEINIFLGSIIFILTILLSWATYKYIEQPFLRFRQSKTISVIFKGYLAPLSLVIVVGFLTITHAGFPSRFNEKDIAMEAAIFSHTNIIRSNCLDGDAKKLAHPEKCSFGIDKANPDILLVGDSHANHFEPMIDVFAKDAGLRGYEVTQNSTLFLPNVERFAIRDGKNVIASKFKIRNDVLIDHLKNSKYKFVVLAGSYADSYTASVFKDKSGKSSDLALQAGVESSIDLIKSTGAKPILVIGSPKLINYDQSCPLKKQVYGLDLNCNIKKFDHDKNFKKWTNAVKELSKKYPDLIIVDPTLVLCSKEECFSELNGIPLYKDMGHINNQGAALIGKLYLNKFGNPFLD